MKVFSDHYNKLKASEKCNDCYSSIAFQELDDAKTTTETKSESKNRLSAVRVV